MELNSLIRILASGIDKTQEFLIKLINDYPIPAIVILTEAERLEIVGNNLYRLYEISNKDFYLMQHLCNKVPNDILINVCNITGDIKTIQEYIDSYNPH